ncbi:MAG TPA: OmpA family protein [Bdellovibrionota bacterium]|nr:OmpA family protein [Bdellovibrionota bacterium]
MKIKSSIKRLIKGSCLTAGLSMVVGAQLHAFSVQDREYDWYQDRGGDCWFFGKTASDPLCRSTTDTSTPKVVTSTRDAAATVPAPISLDSGGLFELNSAELRPSSKAKVVEIAKKIKNEKPNARELSVTGYADPTGPSSLNQELSELRAQSVKNVLVEEGVRSSSIKTDGRGSQNAVVPLNKCEGKTGSALSGCLAPNRRIEVDVL